MIKWINKMMRNKKGFTLIELIVVIAILGILAAIAVPRLSGFQEKARTSADQTTYQTIDRAIAIGVADEVFKTGTVILTTDADGDGTFSGTANANVATEMAKLVESTPVFKKSTHKGLAGVDALTWTIAADGTITRTVPLP